MTSMISPWALWRHYRFEEEKICFQTQRRAETISHYAALLTKYKKVHDHWPKIKSDKVELPRIPMNSLLHPFHLFMSVFMYHLCNCIMTDLFHLYSAFLHDLQHKFKNICVFLEGSYKIQKIVEYFKTSQELQMLSPSLFIQGSQCKC